MHKKTLKFLFLIIVVTVFYSFTHKFYVSITQMDYNRGKKQIEISTRYFIDDIEKALDNKYKEKIYIDTKTMTEIQKKLLEQYLITNYQVKINGKNNNLKYLGFEIENDILITYFTIPNLKKIKSIDIKINSLFEIISTQQHIIHAKIHEKTCSLLLTEDNKNQTCNYE